MLLLYLRAMLGLSREVLPGAVLLRKIHCSMVPCCSGKRPGGELEGLPEMNGRVIVPRLVYGMALGDDALLLHHCCYIVARVKY